MPQVNDAVRRKESVGRDGVKVFGKRSEEGSSVTSAVFDGCVMKCSN